MKNWIKDRIELVAVVLIALLILGGVTAYFIHKNSVSQFWGNGIHSKGDYTNLSTQRDCYILDPDGKLLGMSVFSIQGVIHPDSEKDGFHFAGHMEVDGYSMPMKTSSGSFSAFYMEKTIQLSNQSIKLLHPEAEYWYHVFIAREDPQIIVVRIYDDTGLTLAVCADSEQQAMENYDYYLEHMYLDGE